MLVVCFKGAEVREKFLGFYPSSNIEIIEAKDSLIVLDSNVLLNVYNYSEETREVFFAALQSIQDRIWVSYYTALEFQRFRKDVVLLRKNGLSNLTNDVEKIVRDFKLLVDRNNIIKKSPILDELTQKNVKMFEEALVAYNEAAKVCLDNELTDKKLDEVHDRLAAILEGKIGEKPSSEWLKIVEENFSERVAMKCPPCVRSRKHSPSGGVSKFAFSDRCYDKACSDLYLWLQLIEVADQQRELVTKVLFVTDDLSEDWWELSRRYSRRGVRPELKQEIYERSAVSNFSACSSSEFLELVSKARSLQITENHVSEVRAKSFEDLTEPEFQTNKKLSEFVG